MGKVKICTRCMEYVPIYPDNVQSVEEVNFFSNRHYNHPVVCLDMVELNTSVYKRFKKGIHGLNRRLQEQ